MLPVIQAGKIICPHRPVDGKGWLWARWCKRLLLDGHKRVENPLDERRKLIREHSIIAAVRGHDFRGKSAGEAGTVPAFLALA